MSKRSWSIMGHLVLAVPIVLACLAGLTTAAGDGSTPAAAPLRTPLWTFATEGEIWSSPTVGDGVVYFGSDDCFLYAVDAATHGLKWKYKTGGLVRSRPAVADDTVYFTSDDNYLYAVEAGSGQTKWRFDMGREFIKRGPLSECWDYSQSSPAVAGGVVYVGAANANFYAVDAGTGKEKWRFKVVFMVRDNPCVVDGVVYFGDWLSKVYALDARTGKEKWYFWTGGAVIPSPTVVNGVVYIGSKYPALFAIDARTGEEIWRFGYPMYTPWVESTAAVADGTVYVGSAAWRRLNALDAATGGLKWQFVTEGFPLSSPAVAAGVVYIGATGGFFYAVDAATGRELWQVRTGECFTLKDFPGVSGGAVSSPTIADGVVYFGGLDGKLHAVSTAPQAD